MKMLLVIMTSLVFSLSSNKSLALDPPSTAPGSFVFQTVSGKTARIFAGDYAEFGRKTATTLAATRFPKDVLSQCALKQFKALDQVSFEKTKVPAQITLNIFVANTPALDAFCAPLFSSSKDHMLMTNCVQLEKEEGCRVVSKEKIRAGLDGREKSNSRFTQNEAELRSLINKVLSK